MGVGPARLHVALGIVGAFSPVRAVWRRRGDCRPAERHDPGRVGPADPAPAPVGSRRRAGPRPGRGAGRGHLDRPRSRRWPVVARARRGVAARARPPVEFCLPNVLAAAITLPAAWASAVLVFTWRTDPRSWLFFTAADRFRLLLGFVAGSSDGAAAHPVERVGRRRDREWRGDPQRRARPDRHRLMVLPLTALFAFGGPRSCRVRTVVPDELVGAPARAGMGSGRRHWVDRRHGPHRAWPAVVHLPAAGGVRRHARRPDLVAASPGRRGTGAGASRRRGLAAGVVLPGHPASGRRLAARDAAARVLTVAVAESASCRRGAPRRGACRLPCPRRPFRAWRAPPCCSPRRSARGSSDSSAMAAGDRTSWTPRHDVFETATVHLGPSGRWRVPAAGVATRGLSPQVLSRPAPDHQANRHEPLVERVDVRHGVTGGSASLEMRLTRRWGLAGAAGVWLHQDYFHPSLARAAHPRRWRQHRHGRGLVPRPDRRARLACVEPDPRNQPLLPPQSRRQRVDATVFPCAVAPRAGAHG